jgi:hypothetical protein
VALVFGAFLALTVVGFLLAQAMLTQSRLKTGQASAVASGTPGASPAMSNSAFGQFPPATPAEREVAQMLQGKDEDIDLALANWLIAADVPQFAGLTREAYLAELDKLTGQVRQDMAAMRASGWKGADPKDPASRCRMFCNAIIRLRFAYTEQFRQDKLTPAQFKALHSDASNTFLKCSVWVTDPIRGRCLRSS